MGILTDLKIAFTSVYGSKNAMALLLVFVAMQVPHSYSQSQSANGMSNSAGVNGNAQPHPDLAYPTELSRVVHSSFDELDKIPKREVYRVVFTHLLEHEETYRARFPAADWLTLENIPSHSDRSIVQVHINPMKSTCFIFEDLESHGLGIEQLVELYVESVELAESALDEHYIAIFKSLSEKGEQIVSDLIETYRGTNRLAFSRVNFSEFAYQEPDGALDIMKSRCAVVSDLDIESIELGKTIKAELEENKDKVIPMFGNSRAN
ncbi:MAG: hypothetical protein WDZ76_06055 [Pseudohongiellaceae bacterium]